MHRWKPRRRIAVPALALLLALTPAAGSPAATATTHHDSGASATGTPEPPAAAGESTVLTLITGDRVHVATGPDGLTAVTVDLAEREGAEPKPSFETIEDGENVYVLPSDAAALVPHILDRELFNVTKLAEYGYHDAVPVIVTYEHGGAMASRSDAEGMTNTAALDSIDAVAATIDAPERWWQRVAGGANATGIAQATTGGALAGVNKVWLDEIVEVNLADSVPQVGAPDAWDAGLDGTGVTVAVLDTGIDPDHPDVADRIVAAENFTTESDTTDEHGHGTHVASTVAGSGAASDGTFTGVAPGADLINAKVCNASGSCQQSWMLDGMEWAAQQADVINMSVGGAVTDGTDPLSQAVDALTAEHDTLFVISAGNSGTSGVTTPATASRALAVGAVDKNDELAGFSSRGPRAGDFAIKPDMTAPGVAIIAARADGTSMGTPVNDYYTSANGTSMAAPHVAGAAGILLQQDPTLGADALKATLATTATPHSDLDVYQQGGGRLDVAAAVSAPVRATPAPVDLGYFEYPHDGAKPVDAEVTYTSRNDELATLELSLEVASRDGDVPSDEMLSVTPSTLTLDPGGTATATLTLDVREGEYGLYGGSLVATSDGEVVSRTPVGFNKGSEHFDLTVVGIARDGRPAQGIGGYSVQNVDDRSIFHETGLRFDDGEGTVRVPPGTYSVVGFIFTYDEPHVFTSELVATAYPEFEVTGDTTIVLDARDANPYVIETPAHDTETRPGYQRLGFFRESVQGGSLSWTFNTSLGNPPIEEGFFATPTAPVSQGSFEHLGRFQLVAPGVHYDLVLPWPDQVPEDLSFVADAAHLAAVGNDFHFDAPDHDTNEIRHYWRPWASISIGFVRSTRIPQARTEYLVPGDTRYRQSVYALPPFTGQMLEPVTFYDAGEHRDQSWLKSPARPGVLEGEGPQVGRPVTRTADALELLLPEWVDAHRGHWGWMHTSVDTASFRFYRDGDLVAEEPRPRGTFPAVPEPATYRLELDVARDAPWWTTSTETSTAWTLQSEAPASGSEIVPFLLVDYDLTLDLLNRAPQPRDGRGKNALDFTVRHQRDADGPAVEGMRLWVSYDDGATWRERQVSARGEGRFRAILDQRDPGGTSGFVSLRLEAWDAADNRIEQEIKRAYALHPGTEVPEPDPTDPGQHATDFTDDAVGEPPAGWSPAWRDSDWTVLDEPRRLRHVATGAGLHALTWQEVGDDGHVNGNVEVSALVRVPAPAPATRFQVPIQVSGEAGSENGYYVDAREQRLRIWRIHDGTLQPLVSRVLPFTVDADDWYHVVLQRDGDMLRAKIWPDGEPEPDAWQTRASDPTLDAGKVGLSHNSAGAVNDWAFIGVGAGGEAAPRAPAGHVD